MNLPLTRCRRGLVGLLALVLSLAASPVQANLIPWTAGYGYSSYYAPSAGYGYSHTAHYGGHGGGCCLLNLFNCCGLFGHSTYSAGYAPSYQFAPACCPPACDPCGGCGSCGTSGSCGTCGTYGSSGACGSCGTGGYSASGWGSTCPSGDCGVPAVSSPTPSPSPYSGEPVTPPSSSTPSRTVPPQTYREDGQDDGFRQPQPIPGTNEGGLFPPTDGASEGGSSSGVSPAGGTTPDPQIERNDGIQFDSFKIPARDRAEDANDADDDDNAADEAAGEESGVIEPLQIDAVAASSVVPQRQRAHYRAIFHAPSVARTQVPGPSGWEALNAPSLADAAR